MKKIIIALLVASLMVITATAGVEQAGVEQLASCSSDECGAIDKSWSEIRYYVSVKHKSHWYNPARGILDPTNSDAGWSGTSRYLTSGVSQKTGGVVQNSGVTITIKDFKFNVPGGGTELRIKAGDTVRWVNQDEAIHTVTSDNGEFDSIINAKSAAPLTSGTAVLGNSFVLTFDKKGTYSYHCSPHPAMTGKIIVE